MQNPRTNRGGASLSGERLYPKDFQKLILVLVIYCLKIKIILFNPFKNFILNFKYIFFILTPSIKII